MLKYLLVAITALSASVISAETLSMKTLESGEEVIFFDGDYTKGSAERLYNLATESKLKTVMFSSSGGSAFEGIASAYVMRDLKLNAFVAKGDRCMSACAATVLGATVVNIEGLIGFHPAYLPTPILDGAEAFISGQKQGVTDTIFYKKMGVSDQVISAIHYFGKPDVFFVVVDNVDYYRMFESVNDGFNNKELFGMIWSSEVIAGYLFFTKRGITL